MGLIFNRKKKNKKKESENADLNIAESAYLETPKMGPDMVSLIKDEQEDLMNPFVDGEGKEDVAVSVAKRYGTKYAGIKGRQLASSKVVDVRSYVKPVEVEEPKEKTAVEKELEGLEREKSSASRSFFDDILKSIEEGIDDEPEEEEALLPPIVEPEPVVKKVEKPVKKATKKPTKRRKSIDIDIISGDFGGTDII